MSFTGKYFFPLIETINFEKRGHFDRCIPVHCRYTAHSANARLDECCELKSLVESMHQGSPVSSGWGVFFVHL